MNWRTYGDVPFELWRETLVNAGSPLVSTSKNVYDVARPHSALALAQLRVESQYATSFSANSPANRNALNLRPRGGVDGFQRFDNWEFGVREWERRITDANYAYVDTTDLDSFIHVFAPNGDGANNEAAYVASIKADLKKWGISLEDSTVPDTITFGRVPYPAVVQSHLPASNPFVKESGAPDVPDAMFWHIMVGSLKGTDGWFHLGKAATAYGVGVASTDGPTLAGVIYEWIKPRNGWYGESSGPAVAPYGDGTKFIAEVGVNSVNRCSKAIEISGNENTPLDDKARLAIVSMTAYWADQRKIPWTDFPIVPGTNRSFVIWHNEITGLAFKTCPGRVVMAETPALIENVKQTLKRYQTVSVIVPPTFAEKRPIPKPHKTKKVGGKIFTRHLGALTLARETVPLQFASPTALPVGKPYPASRKVTVGYITVGDDGELWCVESGDSPGARFPLSAFADVA